jgi:mannose-6-phosphate isomerase
MKKLCAIKSTKIWGYENWIASTHPNGFQKEFFDFAGGDFPLLVKVIQADEKLSVQVHPDDERAMFLENCRGKTECWLILSAEENSRIVYGLNKKYSGEELEKAILENSLENCLRYKNVKKGDFIFIPAGTVHAIGGGLRLLEIQQSSDITYRLYDWGRGRECHVKKGIGSIKENREFFLSPFEKKISCEFFSLEEFSVNGNFSYTVENSAEKKSSEKNPAETVLFFVLEGSGKICGENFCTEEIFAALPGEKLNFSGEMKIMKISCA